MARCALMPFVFLAVIAMALAAPSVAAKDVEVGLYMLNMGKFDIATGSFTADFYLSLKCDGKCPSDQFEFSNGRATSIDKIIDEDDEKFYRVQASLSSPVDLREFPFDEQRVSVILEDKYATSSELTYVPNLAQSGIDESIVFPGWEIKGWGASAEDHLYKVYGEEYSRYIFSIDIGRIPINSFFKTILPVFFIVMVVVFSFILDPDKVANRLAMVGSSLVASVMFHVSINNQIPPVGYLTFADKFMVLTYFVLLISFVINIALLELAERKDDELVQKLHRRTEFSMLVIVPLLYVLLWFFL